VNSGERHATEAAVNPTGVSDERALASQLLPGGFLERIQHILRQVNLLPIVNMFVTLLTSQETVRSRTVRINHVLQVHGSGKALIRY
jgi:hypothetical protein